MTNLEWLKKTMNGEKSDNDFCYNLHKKVKNKTCDGKSCQDCPFNYFEDVIDYLLQEHKETIKLRQFEYDIIKINNYWVDIDDRIKDIILIVKLKEKGYFKGIKDTSMTPKDILEKCEIVPDDYEF